MSNDDTITLGGQVFPVKGFAKGNAISEFETGVKIGRATYDSREHAFFLVLDDFSGGHAHRRLDIREELGTFWESLDTNAPDLSRAGHITLPGPISARSVNANPTVNNHAISPGDYPWMRITDGAYVFGIGNSLYRTTDGLTFTRVNVGGADASGVGSIARLIGRDGTGRYFAAYISGSLAGTGTARYRISTDGITWSNGAADKVLPHAFVWDNKIIAEWQSGIIFGTITAGVESWNIDDANDAESIWFGAEGFPFFIGVAQAPWGEPALYFHDSRQLFVLDFFARKAYPIDTGIGRSIHDAKIWNGDIALNDGWNVFLYSPGGQTVRNIGWPMKDGVPPTLNNTTKGIARIRFLTPSDNYLYAVVGKRLAPTSGTAYSYLYRYNGIGWCQLGTEMQMEPFGLFQANFITGGLVADRKLVIYGAADYNSLTARVFTYDLPDLSQVPAVGIDNFGPSGAQWTSGWIDGGFNEIDGTLLRFHIDGFSLSATETVRVEYRLDNNESSSAWVQLVDALNAADVFDNNTLVLYFSQAVPKRGIKFRNVQFRYTINRGGDQTKTPEIKAFTLVYLKTPSFRSSWTFQIDINRMIERSATGGETTYYVDGNPATMKRIWAKLRSLWTNSHTLLSLVIPNIEDDGINVKITDMPLTFDDFRNAVDGQGYLDLQVIEPVAS